MMCESYDYVTETFRVNPNKAAERIAAYVSEPAVQIMSDLKHVVTFRNNAAAVTLICDMSEVYKNGGDMSAGWLVTITYLRAN